MHYTGIYEILCVQCMRACQLSSNYKRKKRQEKSLLVVFIVLFKVKMAEVKLATVS